MFVSNLVAGIIGIILFCGFLGIMMAWVKALPLIVIMCIVIAMMLYDFYKSMRDIRNNNSQ